MREADFFGDFDFFTNKILNEEPFAFSRYADGEVRLMKGKKVKEGTQAFNVDNWYSDEGLTRLGEDLLGTTSHTEDNYFYAISGLTDSKDDYQYLNEVIKSSNKTFVNLWINANYQRTMQFYNKLNRDVVVMANHNAVRGAFPFSVKDLYTYPNNCVQYWEENRDDVINGVENVAKLYDGMLFFVSVGPLTEVLIHYMYFANPNNTYVDVGSSIDEFVHGRKTRPYMNSSSPYSKLVSVF